MAEGADLLDVGGVKAGPGPAVGEAEELDRVIPAIEALRARFDIPLSVDTWRASVADEAYAAGAVVGNDISGFADPEYLPAAAAAGATVVATHIRLGPRIPDPDPVYDDVVEAVGRVPGRAGGVGAGRRDHRRTGSSSTPASTWARRPSSRSTLLRASDRLAGLGYPLLLSASNKTFLGRGARPRDRRAVGGVAGGHRPRAPRSGAGSCGSTTWPPTARCARSWPPSTRPGRAPSPAAVPS